MNDNRNRNKRSGGGGGGGNNQRRRRGRNNPPRDNTPRGPVMTALGESTYEAVFDHGNEGYGVWFDGVVREDPMYRQHWKGNRPIFVRIEQDQILITRELDKGDAEEETEEVIDIGNDARVDDSQTAVAEEEAEDTGSDDEEGGSDNDSGNDNDSGSDSSNDEASDPVAEGRIFTPEEAAEIFLKENAGNGGEAAAKPVKRTARPRKKPTPPADAE